MYTSIWAAEGPLLTGGGLFRHRLISRELCYGWGAVPVDQSHTCGLCIASPHRRGQCHVAVVLGHKPRKMQKVGLSLIRCLLSRGRSPRPVDCASLHAAQKKARDLPNSKSHARGRSLSPRFWLELTTHKSKKEDYKQSTTKTKQRQHKQEATK